MLAKGQAQNALPALDGFSSVYRYWDTRLQSVTAKIKPGECYVTLHEEVIATVLGSCIAACVRDPSLGIGGMNHFMLPEEALDHKITRENLHDPQLCYGNWAMEYLINSIVKRGGRRERLEIKVFGGGQVISGMKKIDIGQRNIEFVENFLLNDGLKISASDLGGDYARKLLYFPKTGKARMKKINTSADTSLISRERAYLKSLDQTPKTGSVELF